MAFQLDLDLPLPAQLRRLAAAQVAKARDRLGRSGTDRDEAIHEARRAVRRARAVVAFALARDDARRTAFEAPLRVAGRALSPLRDSASGIEALEWLGARDPDPVPAAIRARLQAALHRAHARTMAGADAQLALAAGSLDAAARVAAFGADEDPVDPVASLVRAYRRARRRLGDAIGAPDGENLHRFRRRMRTYYWQLELMRALRPGPMSAESAEVRRVTQALGRARDLELLEARMARWRDGRAPSLRRCRDEVLARAAALRDEAIAVARVALAAPAGLQARLLAAQLSARRGAPDAGRLK